MMHVPAVKNLAVFVVHENHPAVVPVDAAVGKIKSKGSATVNFT
jgi:hypothetical protein